jgi:hypothetical protein
MLMSVACVARLPGFALQEIQARSQRGQAGPVLDRHRRRSRPAPLASLLIEGIGEGDAGALEPRRVQVRDIVADDLQSLGEALKAAHADEDGFEHSSLLNEPR